jgi:uncharacterized protein
VTEKTEYQVPSWNQIYRMLLAQARKIQNQPFKPDITIGIARGGIVPARVLTDLLETPSISIIQVEFYSDIAQTKPRPMLKQPLPIDITCKKALLVDDIADTGESLNLAQTYIQKQGAQEVKTATLYFKPQAKVKPDFFEKQTAKWVVFPWEAKETLREILQKEDADKEITKLLKAGFPKQLAQQLSEGI